MSKRSPIYSFFLAIFCVLLNIGGRWIANYYHLPVWMDMGGTAIAAYAAGPLWGGLVGIATGLPYLITQTPLFALYGLAGAAVGITIGFIARKWSVNSVFWVLTMGVVITAISVAISVPINFLVNKGNVGNFWGDNVMRFLISLHFPSIISAIIGEFYVDFLDKVLTVFLLAFCVHLKRVTVKRIRRKTGAAMMLLVAAFCLAPSMKASAAVKMDDLYSAYIQTVYNSQNGLTSGEANDIVMTPDGVLWIGTYAGLYRYSGNSFRMMNELYYVKNVNCLYVDSEERLWVGTNDSGFTVLKDDEIIFHSGESFGLPSESIRSIVEDKDGCIYIGTTDSLVILKPEGNSLQLAQTVPEVRYAIDMVVDESGYVAATTFSGELFLLKEGRITDVKTPEDMGRRAVCCFYDEDGLFYVGDSTDMVTVYQKKNKLLCLKKEIRCEGLRYIKQIRKYGQEFFICSDTGVGYINAKRVFQIINTNEFNSSIESICMDYQGNFWFASSRMGLLRLCQSVFTNIYTRAGLSGKVVNSVVLWQNDYYIGTDRGLDIIDKKSNLPKENMLTRLLNGVRIRCVLRDSRNHLWVCSYGKGLIDVDQNGNVHTYDSASGVFGDMTRVVIELQDGSIAAAGDMGISFIRDGGIIKSIKYGEGLSNAAILNLMETRDGIIYAGSDGDGIYLLQDGEVVNHIGVQDGLSSGVILRTVEERNGSGIFVVTSNSICYIDGDGQVRVLNGFPYYNNYDLWEDYNGNLFVLSSAGIFVVKKNDVLAGDVKVDYQLLDAKSGLSASLTVNSWNYLDKEGKLYLSTESGVYSFSLQEYSTTNLNYRMMISALKMDGTQKKIEEEEQFVIPAGIGRIEIVPEVVNYSTSDPYVRYYLGGFDTEEYTVPQSELSGIVYTNLPKGNYVFHLTLLDEKRENVILEKHYTFVKAGEFYDTPLFRFYLIFVLLLAVAWLTWFVAHTHIQRMIRLQQKELDLARQQISMGNETILAIAKTVDAKDENTSQHSTRVSEYSAMIGAELGMFEDEVNNLRRAALLHDIGKIGVTDSILNKPGRLTDEEYEIMKSHVTRGAEILKDFTLVEHVVEGALYHHERYDGTGYIHGLKGEEIPLYGRIIGVADAFDAMTANRVYRKKLSWEQVLEELHKGSGTQFDPAIVGVLIRLIEEKKIDIDRLYEEQQS